MSKIYDVAVIGNGMIGAAASKYLSGAGLHVAAIGPAEPANWKTHTGVFASHYDQGRITRIIDPDNIWAALGARSIAAYAEIEAASGIKFHAPVGCLRVSPFYQQPGDTLADAAQHGRNHNATFETLSADQLAERFPFLHFAAHSTGLWEQGGAGYINPRSLVEAQLTIAASQGADILRETATRITLRGDTVEITTGEGNRDTAHKVVVAAGAYTNHLLPRKLDLRPRAVSVLLAQVDQAEAERLAAMPSIIYRLQGNRDLFSIYALPPIRYPDGNTYVKIGGTVFETLYRSTHEEFVEWFHGEGNPVETNGVKAVLQEMVPGLRAQSYTTRPCVVTYTPTDHPYIDALDHEDPARAHLFVAAGGCGAAAKSSNELGRIAALLVANGAWTYDFDAANFKPVFVD